LFGGIACLVAAFYLERALCPFFIFGKAFSGFAEYSKRDWTMKAEEIGALIEPTVRGTGCELWGVQLIQGKQTILRIYIESETGAGIEECEQVSREVSQLLDVEDPIRSDYTLEVSTPGLDRPLFKRDQFIRCRGEQVSLRLHVPYQGQRNFKGLLCGIEGDEIVLGVEDGKELLFPIEGIEKANVVPQFNSAQPKRTLNRKK
jgi:ribosome maturation factor RimP